ncbi:MAG TPA: hypothetical protein VNT99_01165 [Methylomirabilota bacterium]|nr:hypothetical protein [Methylomirabilota bacterium]
MNPSLSTTFDSCAIIESESLLLRAQLRLQIAALQTRRPFEAKRNLALAGMMFAEAATIAHLSMLGARPAK